MPEIIFSQDCLDDLENLFPNDANVFQINTQLSNRANIELAIQHFIVKEINRTGRNTVSTGHAHLEDIIQYDKIKSIKVIVVHRILQKEFEQKIRDALPDIWRMHRTIISKNQFILQTIFVLSNPLLPNKQTFLISLNIKKKHQDVSWEVEQVNLGNTKNFQGEVLEQHATTVNLSQSIVGDSILPHAFQAIDDREKQRNTPTNRILRATNLTGEKIRAMPMPPQLRQILYMRSMCTLNGHNPATKSLIEKRYNELCSVLADILEEQFPEFYANRQVLLELAKLGNHVFFR